MLAPIALFAYNRPQHLRRTVESLRQNELAGDSDLIIYSDAPKLEAHAAQVQEVREFIRNIQGFKSVTVIERVCNAGLARSIIEGVTETVSKYGRIIVLEDDMITSRFFLRFMNDALTVYEAEGKVISIHGYTLPIPESMPETFFLRDPGCWGWATWKRGWDLFEADGRKLLLQIRRNGLEHEFNFSNGADYVDMLEGQIQGRNDSWAIRWYASAFLRDKLTLHPGKSLVQNIGNDGSGRHQGRTEEFLVTLADRPVQVGGIDLAENCYARAMVVKYLLAVRASAPRRFARLVRASLYKLISAFQKEPASSLGADDGVGKE